MSRALDRLLRALAAAGCNPRQVGAGEWVADCPTCLRRGRRSLVEIRDTGCGVVVSCATAHDPERALTEATVEALQTFPGSIVERGA